MYLYNVIFYRKMTQCTYISVGVITVNMLKLTKSLDKEIIEIVLF